MTMAMENKLVNQFTGELMANASAALLNATGLSISTTTKTLIMFGNNVTMNASTSTPVTTTTTATITQTISTTLPLTTTTILTMTTNALTTAASSYSKSADEHHPFWLMVFCSVLFLIAVIMIIRLMVKHSKGGRDRFSWPDRFLMPASRWRLSSSAPHSSSSMGLISTPVYTAMPQASINLHQNPPLIHIGGLDGQQPDMLTDARLDWERQFFDEDAVYRPTNSIGNDPMVKGTPTRLQFNFTS